MADQRLPFREKLNSRKLLVFFLCEFIATALLCIGLIQADHWVTVTITMGGAYMATQAYEDHGARVASIKANANDQGII